MAKERPPLEQMTLRQLRKVASEYNVFRYSRMRKSQLLATVQRVEQEQKTKTESSKTDVQEEQPVEATKFELGQDDEDGGPLASIDENLGELPGGYGQSRIVLLPRDPQWAYTYWDIPHDQKEILRNQGGQDLAIRIYDVTDVDFSTQAPHSIQEYSCDELSREWYLPIPMSDRDYVAEIGYRCWDGRWLMLARSTPVHIPPIYPSDWVDDVFVTVNWDQDLIGRKIEDLSAQYRSEQDATHTDKMIDSFFSSMHHVPGSLIHEQVISSHVFPSGVGGFWPSNMSGVNMSGVGFSASAPPEKPRKFWLIANAELIIYGATEPDANLTIGDRPVKVNSDGTFRLQVPFQDGVLDYPIKAVSADGEQIRSIEIEFTRDTVSQNTNTKENAIEEWFA